MDGNCKEIATEAKYGTGKGKGFNADYTTTYGPHLKMTAGIIGVNQFDGVFYSYNGREPTRDGCRMLNSNAYQCDFSC